MPPPSVSGLPVAAYRQERPASCKRRAEDDLQGLRPPFPRPRATPYPVPRDVLHVIAWSGGKDSSALLVRARDHLPPERTRYVFCDTGWEAPTTYRFIEDVNRRLLGGRLIVLRSPRYASLLDLAVQRGRFPATKARFCTEALKVLPMIDWMLEQRGDLAVYQGIRAEESLRRRVMPMSDDYFAPYLAYAENPYVGRDGVRQRSRMPVRYAEVMQWLATYDCTVERTLFHWKTKDILALCRQHGVLNPLYDMGFDRVGCLPCIMAKKQDVRAIARHFPAQIEQIAQAEAAMQSTFFPLGKLPLRYQAGPYPTIREVAVGRGRRPGGGAARRPLHVALYAMRIAGIPQAGRSGPLEADQARRGCLPYGGWQAMVERTRRGGDAHAY